MTDVAPGPRGAPEVRARAVLGLRVVNHLVLALRAVGEHRRSRGWLAVGAVSVATDLLHIRRLRDPNYRPGWGPRIASWIDALVWAHTTEGRMEVLPVVAAGAMVPTVEAVFDAVAGTAAMPVHPSARPWPPVDARDAAGRATRIIATVTLPVIVSVLIRRRRGLPSAPEHVMWSAATAVLTGVGLRYRERIHRGERQRWSQRTAAQIDEERDAARMTLALMNSPGHDFKKTLFALGFHGSTEALAEAHRQTEYPRQLIARTGGQTVFGLTRSSQLEPPEAATRWLSARQASELDAFLTAAEDLAAEGADQTVRLRTTDDEIIVEYLGSRLALRQEPPPLTARVHPATFLLAVGAFHALDTALLGELPWAAALPPTLALAAGAGWFWLHPPAANEAGPILGISTVATACGLLASISRRRPVLAPLGYRADPAAAFTKAHLQIVAAHWRHLGPVPRFLAATTIDAWLWTNCRRHALPAAAVIPAFLELLPGVVCAWQGNDLFHDEAKLLEQRLQREFSQACDDARRQATTEELNRYRSQLAIARRALIDLAPTLPPRSNRELSSDCDELANWLAAEQAHPSGADTPFAPHRPAPA